MTIQTQMPQPVIDQVNAMTFDGKWFKDSVAFANSGIIRVWRWAIPTNGEPRGDGEFFQIRQSGETEYGIFTDAYDDQPTTGSWRVLHHYVMDAKTAQDTFRRCWNEAMQAKVSSKAVWAFVQEYFKG